MTKRKQRKSGKSSAGPRTKGPSRTDLNGCFVKIFEDENFDEGDAFDKVMGPGRFSKLRKLPGAMKEDWGDQIDSLIVGPNARVHLWEDEDFKDDHLEFGPDRQVPRLGEFNFSDEADSPALKEARFPRDKTRASRDLRADQVS